MLRDIGKCSRCRRMCNQKEVNIRLITSRLINLLPGQQSPTTAVGMSRYLLQLLCSTSCTVGQIRTTCFPRCSYRVTLQHVNSLHCLDFFDQTMPPTVNEVRDTGASSLESLIIFVSYLAAILTFPFSLIFCLKFVQEYERAVIFRLGKILSGGARGPGIFFVLPCTDEYRCVDLRIVAFDVPPQEILSKDSVTVAVDAVVYFKVSNPVMSVINVMNAKSSTQLLAQTFLRNVLGTKTLSEILSDREHISGTLKVSLDEATDHWGIKVDRVEIKDVRLPIQLQRAMAAEAEATREAKAKVIAAEGELSASRALKQAAEILLQSPSSLQLRYLQTLSTIAAEKNSTIIFPFPIELLAGLRRSETIPLLCILWCVMSGHVTKLNVYIIVVTLAD
ncbi:hypothetical protein Btru_065395 [Bulinus truncatus]|nr:hypothetical protein Btru_065395 [Bulinus truncatus]